MNKNVGNIDRGIRVVIALLFGMVILFGSVTGLLVIILGVVSVVLFATSFVSFCPVYGLLKLSTSKREK